MCSVASLANTKVNIYGVSVSQDIYAANYESYTLKYSQVPVRCRYLNGQETLIDGKFQNVPIYRLYLPKQLSIIASDLIVDYKNRHWDILYVNRTNRKDHLQVDVKLTTTILGDFCPNIIQSVSASIVTTPQPFVFYKYLTMESNGTNTKNHFIETFTGSTTGKTASDKTFFGDYNIGGINSPEDSFQKILVNGTEYWMKIFTGVATTDCCSDLIGENVGNR